MKTLISKIPGSLLIAFAAILWGTDSLVRDPLSKVFSPVILVWLEHLTGLLFIAPWVLKRHPKDLFSLKWKEWIAVIFFGVGGSALAGIFYTASIQFAGPAVSILIIKLQPLFVLGTASIVLKEKAKNNLFPWAGIALVSAFVLSFPELDFSFISKGFTSYARGVFFAFLAMALWGFSTVAGKYFLYRHSPSVGVFWRWVTASLSLGFIAYLNQEFYIPLDLVFTRKVLPYLLYLGSVAGVVSMGIYYAGLKKIPASVATFIELIYPLAGVILNVAFLDSQLSGIQVLAAVLLFVSILLIMIPKTKS